MRWIIWRRVRLALMTMPRLASGTSMPSSSTRGAATASSLRTAEIVEDLAALPASRRPGDQVDRHQRIEPVDGVVRGAHGLGEHQRAVGVLDGRREAAEQLVLAARLRHDLAPLRERVEVVAGGAAVGAGVALGEVRDRGEEVAERFERHVAHLAEVLARARRAAARSRCTRPARRPTARTPTNATRGRRAHAVGDGLLEAVAVADAAEVRQQQLGDRVVAALERRGEPEPLLVLREQRPAQGPAAEAVALVGDEQPAAAVRAAPACTPRPSGGSRRARRTTPGRPCRCRPAGRSGRSGSAAVSRPCHCSMSTRDGTTHEHEATPAQRVGGGGDRDVGLARAGDRFDHAAPAATQPADERVELPAVELAVLGADIAEHESASPGSEHGRSRIPARTAAGRLTRVLRAPW